MGLSQVGLRLNQTVVFSGWRCSIEGQGLSEHVETPFRILLTPALSCLCNRVESAGGPLADNGNLCMFCELGRRQLGNGREGW